MYLKSLVLKGFKSFADRSVLNLEPGITAVVGPNGSGKSNISDAVLWVLGERNAKNLRGQLMEDVIFAGSSARKSVSMAEVDLVLDNSDGALPVDYDEVAITRRMYRNGESEYLINGTIARRMDVLDILHDSGLGTGTHSIISQGNLDSILQSKPEDRRALIEEAAGVLKHKQRKAKSQRKLEQMDQSLARVKDVVAEVERTLGPLERKAKRAKAYQEVSVELADVNLQLAVDDLRMLQKKWDQLLQTEEVQSAAVEEKRVGIVAAETEEQRIQEIIKKESLASAELSRVYTRASGLAERFESVELLLQEKKRAADVRVIELGATIDSGVASMQSAQDEMDKAQNQLKDAKSRHAVALETIQKITAEHGLASARRTQLDGQLAELIRQRRDMESKLERERRELAKQQDAYNDAQSKMKLVEVRTAELSQRVEQAQTELSDKTTEALQADALSQQLSQKLARQKSAQSKAQQQVEQARKELDELREELRSSQAQLLTLQELQKASASGAGEARAWVAGKTSPVASVVAPLYEQLSVEPEYEAFVEKLLGNEVLALLVQDAGIARQVGASLRESGMSGEVVVYLQDDSLSAEDLSNTGLRAAAACGGHPLIQAVHATDEAMRSVAALLGDVVVVDTYEQALSAHQRDKNEARFVSRDGCLVWPNGRVSFGFSVVEDGEGALARARHITECQKTVAGLEECVAAAQGQLDEATKLAEEAQSLAMDLTRQVAEAAGQSSAANAARDRAQAALAALQSDHETAREDMKRASETIQKTQPVLEQLTQSVNQMDQQHAELRQQVVTLQDQVMPAREEEANLAQSLADAKLAEATLTERENYALRMLEARARDLALLEKSQENARKQLAIKMQVGVLSESLLATFEELSVGLTAQMQMMEDQVSMQEDAAIDLHEQANAARVASKAAHEAFDQVNEVLSQTRVEKGRLELQVEAAINVIVEDCQAPLETALEMPAIEDRKELEEAAFKLQRRITNMGTINPDAAREYEEARERYDYLVSQLQDLDSARKALAKINRVIDARMKDDFSRTFEVVNKNFQEIFAILFPGGSAELVLVGPDDLENTGVEVTAQPRGKRITKMMLMSGGEKSLVALALLFAVYRTRTTPFYILDEVEAALDDSNLRRLTSYLETLRQSTQFIMITHQRRTMEMADVLFGVSMHSDGVTKVISQKLDHALKYAE